MLDIVLEAPIQVDEVVHFSWKYLEATVNEDQAHHGCLVEELPLDVARTREARSYGSQHSQAVMSILMNCFKDTLTGRGHGTLTGRGHDTFSVSRVV